MRKLLLGVLLLACMLVLPLLLIRSERALIAIAHWSVGTFSPYRLTLVKPLLRPLQGLWSAEQIHLYPATEDGPPFLSILDFSGDIRLTNLLGGTLKDSTVGASQITIYVAEGDGTADPNPFQWLGYTRWLPRLLDVGQIHVVAARDVTMVFPMRGLQGQRVSTNTFQAAGEAFYEGAPLEMDARLSAFRQEDQRGVVSMRGNFVAPETGTTIALDGELQGTPTSFDYRFNLDADYADVHEFTQGYEAKRRFEGALTIKATMEGDIDGFTLSDARFRLDNMPHYGIEAAGTLDYDRLRGSQIALVAAGEVTSMDTVLDWVDLDLTALGRARGSARVTGTVENPIVERFLLRSESDAGLVAKVSGRLELSELRAPDNVLHFDVHGPQLETLSQWTGKLPFEPGPFVASARLRGMTEGVALENLIIEVGRRQTAWARLEGSAGDIMGLQETGLSAARDLRLALEVLAPDSRYLEPALGISLPPGFTVEGSIELQGDGTLLRPVAGTLKAYSSDIDLLLEPRAAAIRPTDKPLLSGLVADLALTMSDTSALSQYTMQVVPVLGEVTGNAVLRQRAGTLALDELRLSVRDEQQFIEAIGSLASVHPFDGLNLETEFRGVDLASLLTGLIQDFHYDRPLGELQGGATLAHRNNSWDLGNLRVATSTTGGPVELLLQGNAWDLGGIPSTDSSLQYQFRDPDLLKALTGLRLNPSRGSLIVRSEEGLIELDNRSELGDSSVRALVDISHDGEKATKLSIDINSPRLLLDDLGLQAREEYRPTEQLDDLDPESRLEKLLAGSPRYPVDLVVHIEGIVGENTRISSLDIHTTGENNRYTLRRFNVGYADTLGEARGIIDLNADPPFVSLAGVASAIPLSTLGKDLGMKAEVSGQLTVSGGLSAQGRSGPELLADTDGSLALALENAEFEGAAYDLLATDLLAWIYSGASQEKLTQIDCTMAQFQLQDGVASSDSLYIETEKMVAKGEAELNLVKRTMDVSVTPRSKSRSLQVPSSVRLYGSFDDPKTSLSPVAAAFDAYAELLSLVPKLTRKLFGKERRQRAQRPCEAHQ